MLHVVEFFSGIGGWHRALEFAGISYEVEMAFDVNTFANDTYAFNYAFAPNKKSIETLRISDLTPAHVWVLSPPCQPYTRNNTSLRDLDDPRSRPLLHLLKLLSQLGAPPSYLFLENVVGFEVSHTATHLRNILRSLNYTITEYILCPTQIGVPNSRPRYYCVAVRRGSTIPSNPSCESSIIREPPHANTTIAPVSAYLDSTINQVDYAVPIAVLSKPASWCFDIATEHSTYTSCFTKNYSRYIKGAGSILRYSAVDKSSTTADCGDEPVAKVARIEKFEALEAPEGTPLAEQFDLSVTSFRYFTPSELLHLFGFHCIDSKPFVFPDHIPLRKRYELIGNSVNVDMIVQLLQHTFAIHSPCDVLT